MYLVKKNIFRIITSRRRFFLKKKVFLGFMKGGKCFRFEREHREYTYFL